MFPPPPPPPPPPPHRRHAIFGRMLRAAIIADFNPSAPGGAVFAGAGLPAFNALCTGPCLSVVKLLLTLALSPFTCYVVRPPGAACACLSDESHTSCTCVNVCMYVSACACVCARACVHV